MALDASTFTKASIANAEFGGTAHVAAETYTLKLFSDMVSLGGIGTEIDADGYEPFEIENNLTNFPTATTGMKANAVAFQMSTLAEDSEEVVSAGLFDEDGNLRYRKVFAEAFIIPTGLYYIANVGDLTFVAS